MVTLGKNIQTVGDLRAALANIPGNALLNIGNQEYGFSVDEIHYDGLSAAFVTNDPVAFTPVVGEPAPDNTLIEYTYCDADNYKSHNQCIIKGILSEEDIETIIDCLNDGEFFIPSQVGLPEKRFNDGVTEADHCWFMLSEDDFTHTDAAPTVDIHAKDLVQAFCDKKGRWDDTIYPAEMSVFAATKLANRFEQTSLKSQIQAASDLAAKSKGSSVDADVPAKTADLIKAAVAYGLEFNWSDSDIIDALTEFGITHEDFCRAGAQDFVRDYFKSDPER